MLTRFQRRSAILGLFFIGSLVFTGLLVAWIYMSPTDPESQRDLVTLLIVISLWEFVITLGMWIYLYWVGLESRKPLMLLEGLLTVFEPMLDFLLPLLQPLGDKIKETFTWNREDKLAYFYRRQDDVQATIKRLESAEAKPEDIAKYKAVKEMIRNEFTLLLEDHGVDPEVIEAVREHKMPHERKEKKKWWGKKEEKKQAPEKPSAPCPRCHEKVAGGYLCPCGQGYHMAHLPHHCVMCGRKVD